MSLVERHLRSRAQLRLPFDSLAVVARHDGSVRAAVVADLLAVDVAALLGRTLRVPRAEFVRPYAAADMTAEEIGREMNVRGVVVCTIASRGTCIDATVEVIDVVREELVASSAFLIAAREVGALEREIVRIVAGAPVVRRMDERTLAAIVETRLLRASGDAATALAMLDALGESRAVGVEKARVIIECGFVDRLDDARDLLGGIRGCAEARLLEATLALRFDRDCIAAETALRAALDADPVSPDAHARLGDLLLARGVRDEAAQHHRIVAGLMPRDRRAQIAAGFEHYFGPMPIEGVPYFKSIGANDWEVRSLLAAGDPERAAAAAATPFARALTGGDVAVEAFTQFERALLFAVREANDAAIAALQSAVDAHDDDVLFTAREPLFARLSADPRFAPLVARLGL